MVVVRLSVCRESAVHYSMSSMVHFSFKVLDLVATILIIFLRVYTDKTGKFSAV